MLIAALKQHAAHRPTHSAVEWAGGRLDYTTLWSCVRSLADELSRRGISALALALPNGAPWVVADLAALLAGITLVPLPPFFSPGQIRHCLEQTGAQAILTPSPAALTGIDLTGTAATVSLRVAGEELVLVLLQPAGETDLPSGIAKITYTSGTTGEPKGVMLEASAMAEVAASLAEVAPLGNNDRHLCLTPLAVLLENIGGVYAPLLAGLTTVLPPAHQTGIMGAAGLDAEVMAGALTKFRAASAILTPGMLQRLVATGRQAPGHLRFLAVGGAPVSPRLLQQAQRLNLPVYEGYGLSECASVVAMNQPQSNRSGSVGKPLPHIEIRIDPTGEVLVRGNLFRGYLGGEAPELEQGWWRTGDLGHLDDDGFLHLTGRRKNLFITAFGRNVAPEWVERELILQPAILQAAVFGEARPWNLALILPAPGADEAAIGEALATVNHSLPDYARVSRWLPVDEPFSLNNGQLTATGRLRRGTLWAHYGRRIEQYYIEEEMTL